MSDERMTEFELRIPNRTTKDLNLKLIGPIMWYSREKLTPVEIKVPEAGGVKKAKGSAVESDAVTSE